MALNLWKIGTGVTSYSPISSSYVNTSNKLNIGEYSITFRAKSASSAIIQVDIDDTPMLKNLDTGTKGTRISIQLTQNYQQYKVNFSFTAQEKVYLFDKDLKGDIIIDSITLVQKPLPKLTINGIDGFNSGKWTFTNGNVIDDANFSFNASATYQFGAILITNVLPNTTYTFSCTNRYGAIIIDGLDSSSNIISNLYNEGESSGSLIKTFTTQTNCAKLKISLANKVSPSGIFSLSNPVLNLGPIPTPYSPKMGDRMVLPTPKKNALPLPDATLYNQTGTGTNNTVSNNKLSVTNYTSNAYGKGIILNVIPGKTYTFSGFYETNADNVKGYIEVGYSSTGHELLSQTINPGNFNFTFTPTQSTIHFKFVGLSTVPLNSPVLYSNLQLEQGTLKTVFTPYNVQVNKKPQKLVPKKNYLPIDTTNWKQGYINSVNVVTNHANRIAINNIPIKANTNYTIKVNNGYKVAVNTFNSSNTQVYNSSSYSTGETFNSGNGVNSVGVSLLKDPDVPITPNEILNVQIQLEEGQTATPFENYQLVLPKRSTGLSFNGLTDYLQLPSMTMDAIEIECLIDNNQVGAYYLIDGRPDLALSHFHSGQIGTAWNKLYVNGVDTSMAGGASIIPKNQRVKFKAALSAPNTFRATIFNINTGGPLYITKGIIYKVTCYLNNAIVAQYDFENPQNIVGNQIIPNAQNLIPSFDDVRWNIHVNAKVLGKDALHLDATAGFQYSKIPVILLPNTNYLISSNIGKTSIGDVNNINTNNKVSLWVGTRTFNSGSNVDNLCLYLGDINIGAFDYYKPQLYLLSGKEGTIYGAPKNLSASEKRLLYAKR